MEGIQRCQHLCRLRRRSFRGRGDAGRDRLHERGATEPADEVPQGTSFAFAKDSTGGLFARFRVAIPSIGTRTRAACTNCGRVCTTSIVSCTHGTTRRRLRSARSVTVVPYSPECVEEEFCELRHNGVPRSSPAFRRSDRLPEKDDGEDRRCPDGQKAYPERHCRASELIQRFKRTSTKHREQRDAGQYGRYARY